MSDIVVNSLMPNENGCWETEKHKNKSVEVSDKNPQDHSTTAFKTDCHINMTM